MTIAPTNPMNPLDAATLDEDAPQGPLPHEKEALELVRNCKKEAQKYRTAAGEGEMSLEDERRDAGNRFMGNYGSSHAGSLEEGYRVLANTSLAMRPGGGAFRLHRARLMRTQNSTVAKASRMLERDAYALLSPQESGFTDAWFLTKAGGKKLKRLLDAALAQVPALVQQAQEAQGALPRQIEQDYHRALAERQMQRQGVLLDTDHAELEATRREALRASQTEAVQFAEQQEQAIRAAFGDVTDEQLGFDAAGEPLPNGPTMPLDIDQKEALENNPDVAAVLKQRDIEPVNDTVVARAWQKLLDNRCEMGDIELYQILAELYCTIFGDQCIGVQWDDEKHCPEFDLKHFLNVWTDHGHFDIGRRDYHAEDWMVPLDRAKAIYPEHAQALEEAAKEGRQNNTSSGFTRGGIYDDVDYQRKMVSVTVGWYRHQQVPMTVDEALAAGKVVQAGGDDSTQVGYQVVQVGDDGQPLLDEMGQPVLGPVIKDAPKDTHHGTDWPSTVGLRQITILDDINAVIEDIRCQWLDTPHVWDINIPRPDMGPFGMGEPLRTRDLDEQINRVLSILANYMAYYQFPQYFWPASVLAEVKSKGFDLHSQPGANIPIPDNEWQQIIAAGGFGRIRHDTPPVPPIFMDYLKFLLQEHDTSSGHTEVDQGRSPSNRSGEAIKALIQQSASAITMSSRFSELAWTRMARLVLDAMSKWMPESVAAEILNRYELPVLREILKRGRAMHFNIKVSMATGRGGREDQERQEAMALHEAGLIGARDTLDALGKDDPDGLIQRRQEEQIAPDQQAPVSPS